MQTKFIMNNSVVQVIKISNSSLQDKLPPAVYRVNHDQILGFHLIYNGDLLTTPKKIYGPVMHRVNKCFETYQQRESATGILMTGHKGTGKSLLMTLLANKMITDAKLPIILIKSAYAGNEFTSFIEDLGECVVIFDEFGKMYASNDRDSDQVPQSSLLSLMDGVNKQKRMMIYTENREYDINEFMLSRPSRIYYHFKYKKLDEQSITEYCVDANINSGIMEEILLISRNSLIFSFDMLQTIIEEITRHNCTVDEAIRDLNIDIRDPSPSKLKILKFTKDGTEIQPLTQIVEKPSRTNGYSVISYLKDGGDSNNEEMILELYFSSNNIIYDDHGKLVYQTEGFSIFAEEIPASFMDYSKLF